MEEDALVLETREHGESDLILTLFCRDFGRLSAIAKGARKSKKRFVNKLEIFSFLQITFSKKPNRSLAFLSEAELHTTFPNLRQTLPLYYSASIIREYLLQGIREGEPAGDIFRLSLWALHNIDQSNSPKTILALFLIHYYNALGYRPDLNSCESCETIVTTRYNYTFNIATGRLSCSNCNSSGTGGLKLSHGTIKAIRAAQNLPLDRLHRVKLSGFILKEALYMLNRFGQNIFQRDIVSLRNLGEV
jgi:DNA repair protein RecO (recombination protein O)